jgi:hypothetical protein
MKKSHFIGTAFSLLVLTAGEKASAQVRELATVAPMTLVNTRAMRNFVKTYATAVDADWQPMKEGGWQVRFVKDSIRYRVLYSEKGNWLFTLGAYGENKLPRDVRSLVRSTYYDYTISYIDEVSAPGQSIVYLVQIRDARGMKVLRVSDGDMETVNELTNLAAR